MTFPRARQLRNSCRLKNWTKPLGIKSSTPTTASLRSAPLVTKMGLVTSGIPIHASLWFGFPARTILRIERMEAELIVTAWRNGWKVFHGLSHTRPLTAGFELQDRPQRGHDE